MALKNYRNPIKYFWSLLLSIFLLLPSLSTLIAPNTVSTASASTNDPAGSLNPDLVPRPPNWIPWEEEDEIEKRQYPGKYPPAVQLPDLLTLPPSDFRLVLDPSAGRKFIRFSNTIWNQGPGVLELLGKFNWEDETVIVTQNIYREDQAVLEHNAGEFEFHAPHGHWHWEGFSLYEVWSVRENGSLEHMLASSDKVGYCIRDIAPQAEDLNAGISRPIPDYNSCYWARQGLSVGWNDTYKAHIPGQIVDISGLPDGVYALKSTVDPVNIIIEAEDTNNSALIYFSIHDNHITVLGTRINPIKPRPGFE